MCLFKSILVKTVRNRPEPSGRGAPPGSPDAARNSTTTAVSDGKMPANLAAVRRR